MQTDRLMKKSKAIALVVGVVLFGMAAVLFGTAAVIYAASPAQANNGPQMTQGYGKYKMELVSGVTSGDKTYWYIIVYNTETGRSKFYYGNVKEGTKSSHSMYNLPSSPL